MKRFGFPQLLRAPNDGASPGFISRAQPSYYQAPPNQQQQQGKTQEEIAAEEAAKKDFWGNDKDYWTKKDVKTDPDAEKRAQEARERSASNLKTYIESQNFAPEINAEVMKEVMETGDPTKLVESLTKSNQALFGKVLQDMQTMITKTTESIREEFATAANQTVAKNAAKDSLVQAIPSLEGKDVALKIAIGIKNQYLAGGLDDKAANERTKQFLSETGRLVNNDTNPGPNDAPNGFRNNSRQGENEDFFAILTGKA